MLVESMKMLTKFWKLCCIKAMVTGEFLPRNVVVRKNWVEQRLSNDLGRFLG
ncbi:hypothetical protein PAHAL_3G113700 [Panicum hallii]|uniref:Uncharacterized protein n=1 Tax=Panicum hallii TaxID=206008 RepID=A0A2T8KHZ8_9POAL|nr:hypothetical protein PAHAL_3G113700 [Panicum hallii]